MTALESDIPANRTKPTPGLVLGGIPAPIKKYERDVPLSGPDFPPPSHLSSSPALQSTIKKFEAHLNDKSSGLKTEDTAFAVSFFSSREKVTLYENYYTPPAVDMGVKEVDHDSVFRTGSISKVITVWAFLIAVGDEHFSDPVTKHIPELADLVAKRSEIFEDSLVTYDDIEDVRWEDITLGQLASHGAGVARDLVWMDNALKPREKREELNLPNIDPADIPRREDPVDPKSIREDFFDLLSKRGPHFPPAQSPVYSNIAFLILAYALESITGQDLATTIETRIFQPLGMSQSSYETPIPGGVVPNDKDPGSEDVMWTARSLPAMDHPGGSNYMSTGDMVRAGQAILQSTLLSPAQTRRWLKPIMLTGYPTCHVGAPWEIRCERRPNNRIYEYYTKGGDIGAYDSSLVLSPQHEVGWVVFAANSSGKAPEIAAKLTDAFSQFFIDAIEEQAKIEAGQNFDGTYVDETSNSSVRIVAGHEERLGLAVLDLTFRGKPFDLLAPVGLGEDHKPKYTLLYPSTLKTLRKRSDGSGEYESRLGFRAIFWAPNKPGPLEDPSMAAWGTIGHVKYGQRALDDWIFELGEDGRAVALDLRALRVKLKRKGD